MVAQPGAQVVDDPEPDLGVDGAVDGGGDRVVDRPVEQALAAASLTAPDTGAAATHRFAVSDDEVRFRQVGARFIGERMGRAEVVPLS